MDILSLLDFLRRRSQKSRRSWKLSGLEIRRGRRLKVVSSLKMVSRYVHRLAYRLWLMSRNESGTSIRLLLLVYGSDMELQLSLLSPKVSS